MGKQSYLEYTCRNSIHHHEYNLDHQKYSCTRCCQHDCRCPSNRCRNNLCNTEFSVRLGGFQDGLNFRLRQLLWCEAEFELTNGNKIQGTIISVGSNFVEVLIEQTLTLETQEIIEGQVEEILEVEMDKVSLQKPHEEEYELCDECGKRNHEKCKSWIYSIDKIANIKVTSTCHKNS